MLNAANGPQVVAALQYRHCFGPGVNSGFSARVASASALISRPIASSFFNGSCHLPPPPGTRGCHITISTVTSFGLSKYLQPWVSHAPKA